MSFIVEMLLQLVIKMLTCTLNHADKKLFLNFKLTRMSDVSVRRCSYNIYSFTLEYNHSKETWAHLPAMAVIPHVL